MKSLILHFIVKIHKYFKGSDMEAYLNHDEVIVKDFDPSSKKYIKVKQFVINLFCFKAKLIMLWG